MSGRGRLALCAFAATMMAAGALLPLVDPATWIVQAGFLVAVQSGVGALTRRVPLARPLTVAVQAVVALLMLTLLFAREEALIGLLPGPDAFVRFGELLTSGGEDVGRYAIPAPATEGIRLMLVGGALLIGLTVDALAVTYRSAAPAGLPLLALYSVAAGLSGGGASWLWFLLAATGYLVLLLAEGRDRLSQWGRVFGGAPRATGRGPGGFETGSSSAQAPVRTGRRIGVLALGIALAVPAVLPALGGGLLGGAGNGPGGGAGVGGTIDAVNPVVTLQDTLNQPEEREWLKYKTNADDTGDMYLRIMALDQFDGGAWKFSVRPVTGIPEQLPQPDGLSGGVGSTEVRTNISAAGSYKQGWLPMPYPATKLNIEGRWRFDPARRTVIGDGGQTTSGVQYSVTSLQVNPTREQLAAAPKAPAALLREYTQVPDSLPADVRATAARVTKGAANDYERAVKLQDWFAVNGGFTYSTQVKSGGGVQGISRFLKAKEGFCVHFSFSMAAMARTLGIPARVAVGFTPGSPVADGAMSVSNRDAHAWPELYFEGAGWTRFEPTPTRGNAPDYTQAQTPSGAPTGPVQPDASASAEAPVAPSQSSTCSRQEKALGECGAAAPRDVLPAVDQGPSLGTILLWTLVGICLLLVPLLPMLLRLRVRTRRLNSDAHVRGKESAAREKAAVDRRGAADEGRLVEDDGARASAGSDGYALEEASARTLAAWHEISDSAWDLGITPDESQTPRKAAARIVRLGRLEGAPADSVHRVAQAVEQVLYAPAPRPGAGLADDARRVRAGLSAQASRGTRLRALLLPPSSVRVVWALSARWNLITDRWVAARDRAVAQVAGRLRRLSRQRGQG
ncbi:transglutaminase TgpA family protein [Streptomyces sp. NPDC001514]